MLNRKTILYSLSDVAIMPAAMSSIEHRSECNPYYKDGKLPIFTAPMPCVVNIDTFKKYEHYGINVILPRTENIGLRLSICDKQWCAFSLNEFEKYFINEKVCDGNLYALIDIANGNMKKLYDISKEAKEYYGDRLKLMVGNIANPETFRRFCDIGVDYVRCSVGSGQACFIDGTLIKTKEGYKPIEKVLIGDEVLTHNNNYKKVENALRFKKKQKIVKINNEIECTFNHQFYVIDKINKNMITNDNIHEFAYWVEAQNLKKDKHLLIKSV